MSKRSICLKSGVALLPMMVLLLGTIAARGADSDNVANPATSPAMKVQGDCPKNPATDAAIVKAIQDKIKADARFNDQRDHINVMSKNGAVKLEGWVRGAAQKNAISGFARKTKCVLKVANLLQTKRTGQCTGTQKACCGGCIDRASDCNCMN
jgi:osmotically-inducible protein OsmY